MIRYKKCHKFNRNRVMNVSVALKSDCKKVGCYYYSTGESMSGHSPAPRGAHNLGSVEALEEESREPDTAADSPEVVEQPSVALHSRIRQTPQQRQLVQHKSPAQEQQLAPDMLLQQLLLVQDRQLPAPAQAPVRCKVLLTDTRRLPRSALAWLGKYIEVGRRESRVAS